MKIKTVFWVMTPYGFCRRYECHENEGTRTFAHIVCYVHRGGAVPLDQPKVGAATHIACTC
jgi:hypothetical protein